MIQFHIHARGWIEFEEFSKNSIGAALIKYFPDLRRADRDRLIDEVLRIGPVQQRARAWAAKREFKKKSSEPSELDRIARSLYTDEEWEAIHRA